MNPVMRLSLILVAVTLTALLLTNPQDGAALIGALTSTLRWLIGYLVTEETGTFILLIVILIGWIVARQKQDCEQHLK